MRTTDSHQQGRFARVYDIDPPHLAAAIPPMPVPDWLRRGLQLDSDRACEMARVCGLPVPEGSKFLTRRGNV